MENQNKENANIELAIQAAQKFEFYFIALVFTILGLSIHTSSIIGNWQCFFEILSWFALTTSGLAGLSRLEWKPIAYQHFGLLQQEERSLAAFKQGLEGRTVLKETGEQWTAEELEGGKKNIDNHITLRKRKIEKVEKWVEWAYTIHKWCFVIGIISLVVARAILALN